jgi:enoyl-CoA hydratase/carnithine racemase
MEEMKINVATRVAKLIEYYRTSQTLCVSAMRGAVDFDLLGLVAATHYRVCSSDTVIMTTRSESSPTPRRTMHR